jgi:hypothetical protein
MRTIFQIACCVLTLLTAPLRAQNDDDPAFNFHFKTIVESAIYECDILGNKTPGIPVDEAPAQAVFAKIGETTDDMVIIRFWNWTSTDKQNKFNFVGEDKNQRKYFLMSKTDFKTKTIPRYTTKPSFAAGTIVVPVKARFNAFDFSTDTHLLSRRYSFSVLSRKVIWYQSRTSRPALVTPHAI